ncbi:MAG: hypothetical protein R2728_15775 [Chitinophagales bacterium]
MRTYQATQSFSPKIKWLFTIFLSSIVLITLLANAVDDTENTEWIPLIFSVVMAMAALSIIWITKLHLEISEEKISYQLTPFEWKTKYISTSDIDQMVLKKQKWLSYGGLGKRRRIFKKKLAYIMNKNYALEIILKNKTIITFSVDHENQLRSFLKANFTHLLK